MILYRVTHFAGHVSAHISLIGYVLSQFCYGMVSLQADLCLDWIVTIVAHVVKGTTGHDTCTQIAPLSLESHYSCTMCTSLVWLLPSLHSDALFTLSSSTYKARSYWTVDCTCGIAVSRAFFLFSISLPQITTKLCDMLFTDCFGTTSTCVANYKDLEIYIILYIYYIQYYQGGPGRAPHQ